MSKQKKLITIERISDNMDCETCGMNWADGAIVTFKFDKNYSFELTPVANCYDGQDYSNEDVLLEILDKLGYEVKWLSNNDE